MIRIGYCCAVWEPGAAPRDGLKDDILKPPERGPQRAGHKAGAAACEEQKSSGVRVRGGEAPLPNTDLGSPASLQRLLWPCIQGMGMRTIGGAIRQEGDREMDK